MKVSHLSTLTLALGTVAGRLRDFNKKRFDVTTYEDSFVVTVEDGMGHEIFHSLKEDGFKVDSVKRIHGIFEGIKVLF